MSASRGGLRWWLGPAGALLGAVVIGCAATGDAPSASAVHALDAGQEGSAEPAPEGGADVEEAGPSSPAEAGADGGLRLPDGGGSSDAYDETDECHGTSMSAEQLPLVLYLLVDVRSQMGDFWDKAQAGLRGFLANPQGFDLDGLRVGLDVFPSRDEACNYASYTDDLAVPFEALPAGAPVLEAALDGIAPQGGATASLRPALQGAISGVAYARLADERAVVVLVTDGKLMPAACGTSDDLARTTSVAQKGLDDDDVRTFVIGMSDAAQAEKDDARAIAQAGGTGDVIFIQKSAAGFQKALQDIRTSALACEYRLPKAPSGQTIDYNRVAVDLKLTGGTGFDELPRMHGDACVPGTSGWAYDDATSPTKIVLCPTICEQLATDAKAQIDIRLGCEPIVR